MSSPRTPRASRTAKFGARWWVPLALVSALGGVLVWLNQGLWWAWLLVGASVLLVALAAHTWGSRRWFVQVPAWLVSASLVAAIAIAAGPPIVTRTIDGAHTAAVATEQGAVVGVRDEEAGVEAFAGIPYAAPPVGDLRWAAPQPALPRAETLIADDFGPSAVQSEPTFFVRAATQVMDVPLENTLLGGYATDEDALRLNIWRSSSAQPEERLPVLVFVHGGSFTGGSGALPAYDGAALAARGEAIVITINYRLGVFGFFADEELGDAGGNQGLRDQIAALHWVQDNIAAFGGDPGRVTVAGESAGSGSACIVGVSPLAAGLVHGLIGESGSCLGTAGDRDAGDLYDTAENARAAAASLQEALGVASLAELRALPSETIQEAAASLSAHWWPHIDGELLPASPTEIYAAGAQNDVPLLLGSNADEASLSLLGSLDTDPSAYEQEAREAYGAEADAFLQLYPGETAEQVLDSRVRAETDRSMISPTHEWGVSAAATGAGNVYPYFFTRVPPDPALERFGAYHGAEVMYAYGNLGADGDVAYEAIDRRLEAEMTGYWLAFVTTGNPNGGARPAWPTLQASPDHVLELGDETRVVPRPRQQEVDFWLAQG
ncbi:carboxylesterase/lipase family protein [Pseudoclavibacter sp. VKM Ac-2867]|uniref:carboxylesterase/lipase family protein n=1 Tax=Pseudoclavibacter sp. VKM Ac-2867 TaxID=2783829 RepID=UPI00188A78EF|nr:carboxylesterase family protein [Pseudoclavibacter sp. VKM Ac-2867]MBF4457869.1 carboxylesterase family protein [Pseudoclavibacter sp. VKM Ac-2867]